jgi:hypothetical protein
MFCKGSRRRNAADRAQEEVAYDGSETGEERPLDYGRLRWHRPPLRMELDGGKAGDDNPGDRHPRGKCDSDPPPLLPTRLPAPRDGRVLEPPLARSVFISRKKDDSQRDLARPQLLTPTPGGRLPPSDNPRKTTVIQREKHYPLPYLSSVTMVVHDWEGPIGLGVAN